MTDDKARRVGAPKFFSDARRCGENPLFPPELPVIIAFHLKNSALRVLQSNCQNRPRSAYTDQPDDREFGEADTPRRAGRRKLLFVRFVFDFIDTFERFVAKCYDEIISEITVKFFGGEIRRVRAIRNAVDDKENVIFKCFDLRLIARFHTIFDCQVMKLENNSSKFPPPVFSSSKFAASKSTQTTFVSSARQRGQIFRLCKIFRLLPHLFYRRKFPSV